MYTEGQDFSAPEDLINITEMSTSLLSSVIFVGACYGSFKMWKKRQKKLKIMKIHRSRRRLVEGCVGCGREIPPGSTVLVCGIRLERFTVCGRRECLDKMPSAEFHREMVMLEVDPSPIKACAFAAEALRATFIVRAFSFVCVIFSFQGDTQTPTVPIWSSVLLHVLVR